MPRVLLTIHVSLTTTYSFGHHSRIKNIGLLGVDSDSEGNSMGVDSDSEGNSMGGILTVKVIAWEGF